MAIYGQVREKPVVFERERINFALPVEPEVSPRSGTSP